MTATGLPSSRAPIPSFGVTAAREETPLVLSSRVVTSPAASLPSPPSSAAPRATPTETTPAVETQQQQQQEMIHFTPAEGQAIVKLAGAVELQIIRLAAAGRKIPLATCLELMDKTPQLTVPPLANSSSSSSENCFSAKEGFLYKFLHASRTACQFRVVAPPQTTTTTTTTPQRTSTTPEAPRLWYLETFPRAERRGGLLHLQKLVLQPASLRVSLPVAMADRDELRRAVGSVSQSAVAASPPPRSVVAPPPTTTTTTTTTATHALEVEHEACETVEDRVRAKHEARRRREESQPQAAQPGASVDETWRLRVADLLWTRSRQVMHRHKRFASPHGSQRQNNKPSPCSFVLSDAVTLLTEQTISTGSKLKRRQLVQLLQELCRDVPEWIRRSASQPDNPTWQPNDTLWIQPLDYQVIRARLGGKPVVQVEAAPVIVKKRLRPTQTLVQAATREQSKEIAGAALPQEEATALSLDPTSPPQAKKLRTESMRPVVHMRRPLRVNPHLVLTDADYQGGERMIPSRRDSPRGLKNLFHQLNAGQRI
jgi:hypothetical protein